MDDWEQAQQERHEELDFQRRIREAQYRLSLLSPEEREATSAALKDGQVLLGKEPEKGPPDKGSGYWKGPKSGYPRSQEISEGKDPLGTST